MRLRDRIIPKCNAALVETIFELMFETLWLAPYDRRRRNAAYIEYETSVRHAARILSRVDLKAADAEQRQQMSQGVHALADSIRRLSLEDVFAPGRCAAALKMLERVIGEVKEGVEVKQP